MYSIRPSAGLARRLAVVTALVAATCAFAPALQADPPAEAATQKPMPDVYKVKFTTTRGAFVVEVHKDWAPLGAERFWRLVNLEFFDDSRIFRVKPDFVAQFGVAADPKVNSLFATMPIKDDHIKHNNFRGNVSFATSGPDTRRTQIFINLKDNTALDKQGFVPFGKVVQGLEVADKFYSGYGEIAPMGTGPDPKKLAVEGNAYAEAKFPRLDTIKSAVIVP